MTTYRCGERCISRDLPCEGECIESRFACPDSSKCLDTPNRFNDGIEDCSDGSDERMVLSDVIDIKTYGRIDDNDWPVRKCQGSVVNASMPCGGMCLEDYWQPCPGNNGRCTRKYTQKVSKSKMVPSSKFVRKKCSFDS